MKTIERRTFLTSSAALGAASLIGTSQSWAGANDRLRVAVIGMGGRGGSVMKIVSALDGIEVATVCDPDENRMRERAGEVAQGENTLELEILRKERTAGFERTLTGVEIHLRYTEFDLPDALDPVKIPPPS